MVQKIVAPTVGESISEVRILTWNKQDGEWVKNGDIVAEIESDKATVEVIAESEGVLKILSPAGEMIPVGHPIADVDSNAKPTVTSSSSNGAAAAPSAAKTVAPVSTNDQHSPAVRKHLAETGHNANEIKGTGKEGRLTKGDVLSHVSSSTTIGRSADATIKPKDPEGVRRVPMSLLRIKIAERLKEAQNTAAMLTTFNEVDLSQVNVLRKEFKDKFKAKHGVNLGFMSFFTRACALALKEFEAVNAYIQGTDVLYNENIHIGIAVGTDRGLVVPVLRNAHKLDFAGIEKGIAELAVRARDGKLGIADMSGGTFTITNGGVYGSMLSTPILNPPQSAILGMHNIQERAVVIDGKIEIRPMMYLAVSYDHRIIDGKEAVSFLVAIKKRLENPSELGLDFKEGL